MALYLTPNDIRIGRCSLPHDWFIGFQVVWGLISVVARVRSGAVAVGHSRSSVIQDGQIIIVN